MMVDTQILSYRFKAHNYEPASISSVVANEFLEVYPKQGNKPRFYLPTFSGRHSTSARLHYAPTDHPPNQRLCDRWTIDFNNDFPAFTEYGSRAVSMIIERQQKGLLDWATMKVSKSQRKRIFSRFAYMCKVVHECVPATEETAQIALGLLYAFTRKHSVKSDFRNSFNDMLILATAIRGKQALLTRDTLLSRFAAARHGASYNLSGENLLIRFEASAARKAQNSRESKGFINKGWQIAVQKSLKKSLMG